MCKQIDFDFCNQVVNQFIDVVKKPKKQDPKKKYFVGVDLGTACVVTVVLNEDKEPVGGKYLYADVVRDGMVVDYIGAVNIVRKMKADLEEDLGIELLYASAAIPPGTDSIDGGAVKNVCESAGYEIVSVLEESTAANMVLNIQNGAVVDIGGGTTGISIFKDGKVVNVSDDATGGTHFSLVLSGAYKKSFEEAELFKRDEKNHKEILPVLKPVIEKISTIIQERTASYEVDNLCLVGGTALLGGIEDIVEKRTGIKTFKPANPMFVTPIGIAFSCVDTAKDFDQ